MIMAQAMEMHKRKAIESAQSAADLKLHLEKYHSQIKEVLHTLIIIIIIIVEWSLITLKYHSQIKDVRVSYLVHSNFLIIKYPGSANCSWKNISSRSRSI